MPTGLIIVGIVVLVIAYLVVQTQRAGPPQLSDAQLSSAGVIAAATADGADRGWSLLGAKTEADGLKIRFDHDDDPEAEATFLVDPAKTKKRNTLALRNTVRLDSDFRTHHIHTRGYVFRVRMRGTGPVVGKEVRIQMHVEGNGTPFGGTVENDDDTDAAVGGWIEFESVEILELPKR